MVCRIEVGLIPSFSDPVGDALVKRIDAELGMKGISSIRVLNVYTVDAELAQTELQKIGSELFSDIINQQFSVNAPLSKSFSIAIAVGFCAGVKDNVGETSKKAIEELLGRKLEGNVYTSKQYLI